MRRKSFLREIADLTQNPARSAVRTRPGSHNSTSDGGLDVIVPMSSGNISLRVEQLAKLTQVRALHVCVLDPVCQSGYGVDLPRQSQQPPA